MSTSPLSKRRNCWKLTYMIFYDHLNNPQRIQLRKGIDALKCFQWNRFFLLLPYQRKRNQTLYSILISENKWIRDWQVASSFNYESLVSSIIFNQLLPKWHPSFKHFHNFLTSKMPHNHKDIANTFQNVSRFSMLKRI